MNRSSQLFFLLVTACVLATSSCNCKYHRAITPQWQRQMDRHFLPDDIEALKNLGECDAKVKVSELDSYLVDRTFGRMFRSSLSMVLKTAANDFNYLKTDYELWIYEGRSMECVCGLIYDTCTPISECYVVDDKKRVIGCIEIYVESITKARLKPEGDEKPINPATQGEIENCLMRIEGGCNRNDLKQLADRDGLFFPFDSCCLQESGPALEAYRKIVLASYGKSSAAASDPAEDAGKDSVSAILHGLSRTAGSAVSSETTAQTQKCRIKYIPEDDVVILGQIAIWLSSSDLNRDVIRVCYDVFNVDKPDQDPDYIECEVPVYSYPLNCEADKAARDRYRELFKKAAAQQAGQ